MPINITMYIRFVLILFTALLFHNSIVANQVNSDFQLQWDFGPFSASNSGFVHVILDPNATGYTKSYFEENSIYIEPSGDLAYEHGHQNPLTNNNNISWTYYEDAPLVSLSGVTDAQDVQRDYFRVRDSLNQHRTAKMTLSGFDNYQDKIFKIQWITTFQSVATFTIDVVATNATFGTNGNSETIGNTGTNTENHYEVRYSKVYTVTPDSSHVIFEFDGGNGIFAPRFGVSGVVITASAVPELENYSLLLGCFGLTWVMSRRRRYASPL